MQLKPLIDLLEEMVQRVTRLRLEDTVSDAAQHNEITPIDGNTIERRMASSLDNAESNAPAAVRTVAQHGAFTLVDVNTTQQRMASCT